MYTAQEKQRMERVLAAFGEYIDGHDSFDICYSKKVGYFSFIINEKTGEMYPPKQLADMDELLAELFFHVSEDLRELDLTGEYHDDIDLFPIEIEETRHRLLPILNTMGEDREYCIGRMENYLEHVND